MSEEDPCGPDLRWDAQFLSLSDLTEEALSSEVESIVDAEVAETSSAASFEDILEAAEKLLAKTKDLRVFAIYAEASWHQNGLAGFASALETLVVALETWPEGDTGIHPRADEFDGDLGERIAAMGRLLNKVPPLAATIGWGASDATQRLEAASLLRGVFSSWGDRVDAAFKSESPSAKEAWVSVQALTSGLETEDAQGTDQSGPTDAPAVQQTVDAWDLIDRALEQMMLQDHHSPAIPILRLLATWRRLTIVEIIDGMKPSGVSLEQLMESIKRQTQPK